METYQGRKVPNLVKQDYVSNGYLLLPCVHYTIQTDRFCPKISYEDCLMDSIYTGAAVPEEDIQLIISYLVGKNYITKADALKFTLDNK